MAVNQAQVDHIISTASADDPEVKLQKLQDEVDLIKVSIKRLLIDIRERMNELENPFAGASGQSGGQQIGHGSAEAREEAAAAREAAAAAREAAAAARDTKLEKPDADGPKAAPPTAEASAAAVPAAPAPVVPDRKTEPASSPRIYDEHLIEALRAHLIGQASKEPVQRQEPAERQKPAGPEKIRLQKVHRLFEWTSTTAKKYGHDRLEMMCESYRAMGYISKESVEQVREIARLMPSSLGECHEIGPDEFVSELYTLNRILDPGDATLDRDMIEVLMEQKHRAGPGTGGVQGKEKEPSETWVQMQDRT